ncbi:hypothetical protein GCM10007385_39410 [Tateyamaria omphalii]|uniref:hypothetical protein n=1 Tax=Tateyamaria omphalii TaxID=299262 RepID=UPI0016765986|nr:hypothetical protein [Tateyamaria omphalii]GGX66302.1 hypothetical protein GCM10007385_39410 [Tateyamaria omphalii]
MVEHSLPLSETNLTISDRPIVGGQDGSRFKSRAEVVDEQGTRTLIYLVPPDDPGPALSQDVMAAREEAGAGQIIHLRSDARVALVARGLGDGFRYQMTDRTVAIGAHQIAIIDLCQRFPVARRTGWNDFPLSGQDLPAFFDTESFLSWWDFVPGKQRFEMVNGQVHLVPRLPPAAQNGFQMESELKRSLPPSFFAIPNMLFRAGALSALHVPVSICRKPLADGSFVDSAAAMYRAWDAPSKRVALDRVALLQNRSIPCAIFDRITGVWRSGDWSAIASVDLGKDSLSLKGLLP